METNLARRVTFTVKLLMAAVFLILAFAAVMLNAAGLDGLRNVMIILAVAVIIIEVIATASVRKMISKQMNDLTFLEDKLAEGSEIAKRIACGDFAVKVMPQSDKDILSISLNSISESLTVLAAETNTLTSAAANGDFEVRGNAGSLQGGFREILEEVNRIPDEFMTPLRITLDYTRKIANGEELENLTNDFNGQFGELINNLKMIKESLDRLLDETANLTEAAEKGDFSYRSDLSRLKGGYAQVVGSVNHALDFIMAPFDITAQYLCAIGKGEIPEKITDTYYGDFNHIKDSINNCIDGLGGLVESRNIFELMRMNDYTKRVEGSYQGIYAELANDINILADKINQIIQTTYAVSIGDYDDALKMLYKIGKKCENDTLVPVTIQLMENVNSLLDVTGRLTTAAIEGDLGVREDSSKFTGAWKDLVDGMNNILAEMAKPLEDVIEVITEQTSGNLKVSTKGTYKGAFAVLAQATDDIGHLLNVIITEISDMLGEIADGNLALEHMREYQGDFIGISNSTNFILDSLNNVMREINEAADQVSAGSGQVSAGSQALSQGSTEQSSSIEELTSSIAEVASQTRQNATDASQANKLASEARDNAVKGNSQMREMLNSMAEINESSTNISKIIKVIDDIAFQTNILALNAAVEAARAGQHGKGFAVVAEEVRSLAARSAEAAKDTTNLIEGSIKKVQHGTQIANETASALSEIVEGIQKAADLVSNIASASNEQASGITQINKGIEQVSQVVQNNSATAEESAAASEELSGQAMLLKEMVGRFKLTSSGKIYQLKEEPKILLDEGEFDKY
ncbi:MAG TPA: methyl-accepting chemotaxis protein [Anaerovoracaceae bacterium]|nr:methyl-accepting chemotaxis protein [Anaerovoracaceae bacterium]